MWPRLSRGVSDQRLFCRERIVALCCLAGARRLYFSGPISPDIAICIIGRQRVGHGFGRFEIAVYRGLANDVVGLVLPGHMQNFCMPQYHGTGWAMAVYRLCVGFDAL